MNRPAIPDSSPRHEARSDPQGLPRSPLTEPAPAQQPGSVQRSPADAPTADTQAPPSGSGAGAGGRPRDLSWAPAAASEFAIPAGNWLG